jgi:hypothetical protein
MERISIGLAVNRDRANAHFFAGTDDAQRDFTAIGDKNFSEHKPQLSEGVALWGFANHKPRTAVTA